MTIFVVLWQLFLNISLKKKKKTESQRRRQKKMQDIFGVSQKHQKEKQTYDKMKKKFSIRIYGFGCFHMRSDFFFQYAYTMLNVYTCM